MAGIAGVARTGKSWLVNTMLDRMHHRGSFGRKVVETPRWTMGVIWPELQAEAGAYLERHHIAMDETDSCKFAVVSEDFILKRDPLGVAPLYYGQAADGALCFASEVKALWEAASQVIELPPAHIFAGSVLYPYDTFPPVGQLDQPPEQIARELHFRLETAVKTRLREKEMGVWLSGGLDSSIMAALARPHVRRVYTFTAGLAGAPDLEYAGRLAEALKCQYHEIRVRFEEILKILPMVIYHLESFDALLVRSSVLNFLAAKEASNYVLSVFSGEGGDELFAGYGYLKSLDPSKLGGELVDITMSLHNTALQRVDRCASAYGLVVYVPFLDPNVVDYTFRIPAGYKLHNGIEKWILRQSMLGSLPESILNRPKSKFWEGAGVVDVLFQYAEEHISTGDFEREKRLDNGWLLNSKEELMYYRIFRETFGRLPDLSWMGRTKAVPLA